MLMNLQEILLLFDAGGGRQYSGEAVTHLEHALQSAQLAENAGVSNELITACLLHDFGHLANDEGETPTLRGVDDRHQYYGVSALKGLFGAAVLTPIRLHVDAKRYLCATEANYHAGLSEDSKRSLRLQGGMYSAADAAQFIAQPHAQDAVRLRRWDDQAKVSGCRTPDLAHYMTIAAACVTAKSTA